MQAEFSSQRTHIDPAEIRSASRGVAGLALILMLFWACFDPPASWGEEEGFGQWTVDLLRVEAMRVHENYLLLDDQPYVLTPEARCFDARGQAIPVADLPESGTVDVRYERRPKDELHPQGGRERILLELRLRPTAGGKGAGR